MTDKISKLTPAQEAELPKFITKWVDMASKPTDRIAATRAVKDMYKSLGEDEPIVIFGESPYSTALMTAMFFELVKTDKKALDDQLRDQLYDQLGGQLGGQLDGQLYDQLRDQLRGQLYDQLRGQLGGQLYDQLRGQLYDQLYDQLRGQLYDQLGDQLYDQLGGQLYDQLQSIRGQYYLSTFWLAWAGWYDYGQYIGVSFDKEKYDLFMAFVSNVGFIIPYKGVAFVSEAPQRVIWNDNKVLSYDHDKAVQYKDGWGLYCLDGVRFTEGEWKKITNQELDLAGIGQANMGADKSAIAMKYARPDVLLEGVKAKLIDTGRKGTELYEVKNFMGTRSTEYCIKMKHPSLETVYIEWVEPKIGKQGSADLCQAKAFDVPLEDYLAAVEA